VSSRSVRNTETASIQLNIPPSAQNTRFYYSITGVSDEDINVLSTGYFTYDTSSIRYLVQTSALKTLTLSLTDYSHIQQMIILNDISYARLTKSTTKSYLYEGETVTIVVAAPYSKEDTFKYLYVISGTVSKSDISVDISGYLTIMNSQASVTITINNDFKTEGSESLIFSVYDKNSAGIYNVDPDATMTFDILDSSIGTSYSLSSNVSTANEGDTFTIYLVTTGVPSGTAIQYLITGVASSDISFVALSDSFIIDASGNANKPFYISNDVLTDSTETFRISLVGLNVNVYTEVTINDTSQKPQYTFFTDTTYVFYTATLSLNVFNLWLKTNSTVPDNTVVAYTITGISNEDISGIPLKGMILTTNNDISKARNTITCSLRNKNIKTFTIRADDYEDISTIHVGFNYSTSSPEIKINVTSNASKTIAYINSTWYGYYNKAITYSISGLQSGTFTVTDPFEQTDIRETSALFGSYSYSVSSTSTHRDSSYNILL
jgi:hypothetical protein